MSQTNTVSRELERSLLGAFLLDGATFFELRSRTPTKLFFFESHRLIYRAMCSLADSSRDPADVIQINDHLQAEGLLEAVGGPRAVVELSRVVPSAVTAPEWCARLRSLMALRELQGVLRYANQAASDPSSDPEELVRSIQAKTSAAVALEVESWVNARVSVERMLQSFARDESPVEPTGFHYFDRLVGGVRAGSSYFLGGLYKAGKSKLALAIAVELVQRGYAVDWYTCEMPHEEITLRALSALSRVSEEEVSYRLAQLSGREPQQGMAPTASTSRAIDEAVELWRAIGDRFRVHYSGAPFVGDIYAHTQARAMSARLTGLKCAVFVDYLQECSARLPGIPRTDRRNIAECCARLNQAAKDAKIPIFVLYQLAEYKVMRRQKEGSRFVPVPQAQDGEGSSKIAQAANEVIMIHRPWFELDGDAPLSSFVVLRRGASRSGSNAQLYLRAQYALNGFSEWNDKLPEPFG